MTDEVVGQGDPKTVIHNFEDALSFLKKLELSDFDFTEDDYEHLTVGNEIARLAIEIKGDDFNGTITGGLARGLWEHQKEIYKAAAFAIYNSDSYRRIPRQELKNYALVFDVEEGSTKLIAKTFDFAKNLIEKAMDGMTPKEKAALLLTIIVAVGGFTTVAYVTTKISDDIFASKTSIESEKSKASIAKAETDRYQIMADLAKAVVENQIASRFNTATEEGIKAIAKHSPDATRLQVGSVVLDKNQIDELNQRSAREVPDTFNIHGFFRVMSTTEPTPEGLVRVGLSGNGREFVAYLNLKADENPITDEQSDAIFLAPKTGKRLYINVKLKETSDGSIREAFIESLPPPPPPTRSNRKVRAA